MGVLKNLRTILPLPASWKGDEAHFGRRIADAIRELFTGQSRLEAKDTEIEEEISALSASKAYTIFLRSGDTTWAKVWAKIDAIAIGEVATIYIQSNSLNVVTGGARSTSSSIGAIGRASSTEFNFLLKDRTNEVISGKITGCSDSSAGTWTEESFANDDLVHIDGTETITGSKSFNGAAAFYSTAAIRNSMNPGLNFFGAGLSSMSARIVVADAENPEGKYGNEYFVFRQFSPSADGSSRTSHYENYVLPKADSALSNDPIYDILTTKNAPTFKNLTAPVGATTNFTLAKSSRMRIDFITTNTGRLGYAIIATSSTGTVYMKSDVGSNVTLATSTNTLSVTPSGAAASMYCTIYEGDINAP